MQEILDVADAFGTPLKVAWVVWLAWGVGQAFWYKHERTRTAAQKFPGAVLPTRNARKREKPAEPLVARLITPQYVAPTPKVESPGPPAPPFDPSKAVVETFDPRDRGDLDAIVADMEANMPRPVGGDAPHVH